MLAEVSDKVTVYMGGHLQRVLLAPDSRRLAGVQLQRADNSTLQLMSTVMVDASYEGDVLRQSGASWTVGREANTTYNEPHAGVQPWPFPGSDAGQIFPPAINYTVDPFLHPSHNGSLLPLVNSPV